MLRTIDRLAAPAALPVALLMALTAAAPAYAGSSLQLSAGAEYSSGDYGAATNTELLIVPFSARLRWNDWSLRASVPFVNARGPADVAVILDDSGGSGGSSGSGPGSGSGSSAGSGSGSSGNGSSGSGGSGGSGNGGGGDDGGGSGSGNSGRGGNDSFSNGRNASGIGDATLSLTRSFNGIAGTPVYVDVIGRVKFASGSVRKGLGVGATDYSALSEVGWQGGKGGVFVNGGRRFLGSTSSLKRVDGWQVSGGGWRSLGPVVDVGAVYNWRSGSVPQSEDLRTVEANLNVRLGGGWQVGFFATAGLSDASPNYGGGTSISWELPLHHS